MVRPNELSRPMSPKRLRGKTLDLAEQYLRLMRRATSMRNRRLFILKTWRRACLDRRGHALCVGASEVFGELFLRFRPLIAAAISRALAAEAPACCGATDAYNRVAMALTNEVERDPSNDCFADLLWKALEAMAKPNESVIQGLRSKVYLRAIVDQCPDDVAVTNLVALAYLRGELAVAQGTAVPPFSDLEFDELVQACEVLGDFLCSWGSDLDRLTAKVLTNQALIDGNPGHVLMAWVQ